MLNFQGMCYSCTFFFMTLPVIKKCLFTLLLHSIDLSIMQSKYQTVSEDSLSVASIGSNSFYNSK